VIDKSEFINCSSYDGGVIEGSYQVSYDEIVKHTDYRPADEY